MLKERSQAPKQGFEGAPVSQVEISPEFAAALDGIEAGQDVWILTWFHKSIRSVLQVHPRGDPSNPLSGVFATRSPDRPNPIGLHRVKVLEIDGTGRLQVQDLEAIDGTPVVDIKVVIENKSEY